MGPTFFATEGALGRWKVGFGETPVEALQVSSAELDKKVVAAVTALNAATTAESRAGQQVAALGLRATQLMALTADWWKARAAQQRAYLESTGQPMSRADADFWNKYIHTFTVVNGMPDFETGSDELYTDEQAALTHWEDAKTALRTATSQRTAAQRAVDALEAQVAKSNAQYKKAVTTAALVKASVQREVQQEVLRQQRPSSSKTPLYVAGAVVAGVVVLVLLSGKS